jgi:hypothetical protein
LREVLIFTGAMGYWCRLEAIEFVKHTVEGEVSYKMVHIVVLGCGAGTFVDEW